MATISKARIGNLALSAIGTRSTIESIDEQSPEAKQVKLWYDFSREQALKAYNWSFAKKRQTLAAHGVATTSDWSFRYQYPADAIIIRKLINPFGRDDDAVPYTVESITSEGATTRCILTDLSNAVALYTYDVQDTTQFTPFFVELLAHLIAHHIAFPLTGDRTVKQDMFNLYRGLVDAAPIHDANEERSEKPRDAEWIRLRNFSDGISTDWGY